MPFARRSDSTTAQDSHAKPSWPLDLDHQRRLLDPRYKPDMQKTMVTMAVLAGLGACRDKGAPPPVTPVVEAPVTPPVELSLDGAPWTMTAAGAVVTTSGQYDLTVTTPGFALTIQPWPDSDVFVRTSAEHLQGLRERDPALEILHEIDGGPGAFQVIARTRGQIDGTVLVPGLADDAMCGFELAADADWRPALDACLSLQPRDEPDSGMPHDLEAVDGEH